MKNYLPGFAVFYFVICFCINAKAQIDASVNSINLDRFYVPGILNPGATVQNNGSTQQTINLIMTITGGYNSAREITLAPSDSIAVVFDPWDASLGNYLAMVQLSLTGDTDPSNDTLSKTIKILEPFLNYGWTTHSPCFPTVGGAVASVCSNENSRIYFMGGDDNTGFTNYVHEYNTNTDIWLNSAPSPIPSGFAASFHANGKIFLIGGSSFPNGDPNGSVQIYDYNSDTWSEGLDLPVPVGNPASGLYKDSLIFIVGGNTGNYTGCNNVQIYDTYTNTWTTGTEKPGLPVYAIRGGIVGNKMIVAGGYNATNDEVTGAAYVGEINATDPSQITWIQVDDHPAEFISRSGTGVSLDGNSDLVIFSGGTNSTSLDEHTPKTFAYDLNSGSWKLGPDKPTSANLFYMTPVLYNDSVYLAAVGGLSVPFISGANEWLNLGYYQLSSGISVNNSFGDLKIFPNPVIDEMILTFYLNRSSDVIIELYDITGNNLQIGNGKHFVSDGTTISVQTKDLSAGVYFCKVKFDGKSITKKIVKL